MRDVIRHLPLSKLSVVFLAELELSFVLYHREWGFLLSLLSSPLFCKCNIWATFRVQLKVNHPAIERRLTSTTQPLQPPTLPKKKLPLLKSPRCTRLPWKPTTTLRKYTFSAYAMQAENHKFNEIIGSQCRVFQATVHCRNGKTRIGNTCLAHKQTLSPRFAIPQELNCHTMKAAILMISILKLCKELCSVPNPPVQFAIFWHLKLIILSYQENYPWVPIQPHTLAKESLTGYSSLL